MFVYRLETTKFDSVEQWLVDIRSLTDSECQCVLQGKSLTADSVETVVSPPKLISGQLHLVLSFSNSGCEDYFNFLLPSLLVCLSVERRRKTWMKACLFIYQSFHLIYVLMPSLQ